MLRPVNVGVRTNRPKLCFGASGTNSRTFLRNVSRLVFLQLSSDHRSGEDEPTFVVHLSSVQKLKDLCRVKTV